METVFTLCLVVTIGLISFSQYYAYAPEAVSESSRFRYMLLTFSITASCIVFVGMQLTYPGIICFLLYAILKFLRVLTMGETVILTEDMVDVDRKYISMFITLIAYSAVALFFVDTIMQGGQLERSVFGVFFAPTASWHKALYFIYYIFSCFCLYTFFPRRVLLRSSSSSHIH